MISADDELLMQLDREIQHRTALVRQMLIAEGREDLLSDFDRITKDIRTGIYGARSTWHALSGKQRYTLRAMAEGRYIARSIVNPRIFHGYRNGTPTLSGQPGVMLAICRIGTARVLSARELIHVDGGATEPESKFVITERGMFVWHHGQNTPERKP